MDNVGFSATGVSSTAIILSADPTMANNTVIGVVSETGLSGDAIKKARITVTLPTNIVPGVHYVSVLADMNNAISESNNGNNYPTNVVKITVSAAPVLASSVLLQTLNGQMAVWQTNSGAMASSGLIGPNPGPSWSAAGTGAFYAGDTSDIIWQNHNGAVAIWQVQGTAFLGGSIVDANPGPSWHIKGTGNFYGDGNTDILLHNDNGSVAIWDMNGASITASTVLANPGTAWNVIGNGAQMQFICSTSANETLAAMPTTSDEFIFTNFAAGAHTITGFNAVQDRIELRGASFASFATVQAATSAVAGGTMITLDHFSSLLLTGVSATSLHASNFAFA